MVLSLNGQCMDHPSTTWHVVVAVESEAGLANGCLRSDRHGDDDRNASHSRHSSGAGRPRRLRVLLRPAVFSVPRPTGRVSRRRYPPTAAGPSAEPASNLVPSSRAPTEGWSGGENVGCVRDAPK